MEKIKNLEDLFNHELQDLYSAENQLLEALPKLAGATENEELKSAFQEHEKVTRDQVKRLEMIADELGVEVDGHTCKGMEGLIAESEELLEADAESEALDAGLIGAAQRAEHYEIAGYGTARNHAQMLGHSRAADLLQKTLDEEGEADKKLTQLAESMVNRAAKD